MVQLQDSRQKAAAVVYVRFLYPAGISSQKTNEENTKFSVLYAANRARPVF